MKQICPIVINIEIELLLHASQVDEEGEVLLVDRLEELELCRQRSGVSCVSKGIL